MLQRTSLKELFDSLQMEFGKPWTDLQEDFFIFDVDRVSLSTIGKFFFHTIRIVLEFLRIQFNLAIVLFLAKNSERVATIWFETLSKQ